MKLNLSYSYFVLGIRPEAKIITSTIKSQNRVVHHIEFHAGLDSIPGSILDKELSKKLCREFSIVDYACTYVHYLAYQQSNDADWYIFFEDDIQISNLDELEFNLGNIDARGPKVVTFNNFESKVPMKYSWWYRAYRTHAYAANEEALKIIRSKYDKLLTGPDWPIQWEYLVEFQNIPIKSVILNTNLKSLLDEGRNEYQQIMLLQYRDFGKRFLKIIPPIFRDTRPIRFLFKWAQIILRTIIFFPFIKANPFLKIRSAFARSYCEYKYLH